ncbi:MAG: DNA-binding protein [Candidatus Igneacidithiobacillus chanchocoensis]
MSRQIVTPDAVAAAAESLIAEGVEPSIIAVQARVGGGSYSTVKKFLDVWKQQREAAAVQPAEMPEEVRVKGQAFALAVWAVASREAQAEAQQAKTEAQAEVAAMRADLVGAQQEIARLEAIEAAQAETIAQQAAALRDTEMRMVEAQTQASRVVKLEDEVAGLRAELDAARRDVTERAVEAGRLVGEVEALRVQVRELMGAIRP